MASAAAEAEYLGDAADFAAEMRENGSEWSFGNYAAGADASSDLPWKTEGSGASDADAEFVPVGIAHGMQTKWNADFSNDVKSDDAFWLMSNLVDMSLCSVAIDASSGDEYKLEKASPEMLGSTIFMYEIQVRR